MAGPAWSWTRPKYSLLFFYSPTPRLTKQQKQEAESLRKAEDHKNKLLEYDRTSARRTKVIDDETDYFSSESNRWLTEEQRALLREKEKQMLQSKEDAKSSRRIIIDIAGRQILESNDAHEQEVALKQDYDTHLDSMRAGAAPAGGSQDTDGSVSAAGSTPSTGSTGAFVNPFLGSKAAPKFVLDPKAFPAVAPTSSTSSAIQKPTAWGSRVQHNLHDGNWNGIEDDGLPISGINELDLDDSDTDQGLCLSMVKNTTVFFFFIKKKRVIIKYAFQVATVGLLARVWRQARRGT